MRTLEETLECLRKFRKSGSWVPTRASTEGPRVHDPRQAAGGEVARSRPRLRRSATVSDRSWEGGLADACQNRRSTVLLDFLGDQRRIFDRHVHPHPGVVPRLTQPPTLSGMGTEYRLECTAKRRRESARDNHVLVFHWQTQQQTFLFGY